MTDAYPLHWPDGWPRTPAHKRQNSMRRWGRGEGRARRPWTFREAVEELLTELDRSGAKSPVISTNFKLTQAGLPSQNFGRPEDQGVAIYFMLDGEPMTMAQDGHLRAEENIRALTLVLRYLRNIEDLGGATMMKRAFSGFAALPPPNGASAVAAPPPWYQVLRVQANATLAEAHAAYRKLAKELHPDNPETGSAEAFARLQAAWEQAQRSASHG